MISTKLRTPFLTRAAFNQVLIFLFCAVPFFSIPVKAQNVDSTLTRRFQLADSYLRAGQFERAINLLEDLYSTQPETFVFYDKLKEAYEGIKRYDDAIALVEDRMKRSPDNVQLMADKARLQYLKGDESGANQTWNEAITLQPDNRIAYRVVYQTLVDVRLLDRAIQVLEAGAERLKGQANFEPDLAYLYSQTGQHQKAMEQYLSLLSQNAKQLHFIRGRLGRFVEQEEAALASIEVTERAVRREPLNRAYREILAWLYMEAGNFKKALDANRAIDRLESENGRVLFSFAEVAADAEAYDAALEAYEEILRRYPDSPAAPEALLGLGIMYEQWARKTGEKAYDDRGNRIDAPHFQKAIDTYQTFLQKYPGNPFYAEVLRRIGGLQRDVFFDLGLAEQSLQEVVTRFSTSQGTVDEAEYDLGRVALLRGQLEEARLVFSRLVERLRTGELAERSNLELALIHFYRGEFEAALTLTEVLDENTSTDVANDAIELKLLLFENKGPDSLNTPLKLYAESHLLQRQREYNQTIEKLNRILAQYGHHALADDVRYLRAETLRLAGKAEEALQGFGEIPLMHPNSYLADKSIFQMGEILEYDIGDKQRALEMYTKLLTDYPGSLLSTKARVRIRTLRGEGT